MPDRVRTKLSEFFSSSEPDETSSASCSLISVRFSLLILTLAFKALNKGLF